jgi:hypothetical protein
MAYTDQYLDKLAQLHVSKVESLKRLQREIQEDDALDALERLRLVSEVNEMIRRSVQYEYGPG